MQGTWRDIAVFLDASPEGEKIGRQAVLLAQRHKAHLVGVYGVLRLVDRHPSEDFAVGESAIKDVLKRHRRADEEKILAAGRHFREMTRIHDISSEFRVAWQDGTNDDAILRSLHCDLIVAAQPKLRDLPQSWTAERLLLNTGTPLLLVPEVWTGEIIGDVVIVAWNLSREARRAVNDAMPFIGAASHTTLLTVEGGQGGLRFGSDPWSSILEHLSRHGASAKAMRVASNGASIADVILEQATMRGANLLVIGAYSRRRAAELLFGGVTRSLFARTLIPTLISR